MSVNGGKVDEIIIWKRFNWAKMRIVWREIIFPSAIDSEAMSRAGLGVKWRTLKSNIDRKGSWQKKRSKFRIDWNIYLFVEALFIIQTVGNLFVGLWVVFLGPTKKRKSRWCRRKDIVPRLLRIVQVFIFFFEIEKFPLLARCFFLFQRTFEVKHRKLLTPNLVFGIYLCIRVD